MIKFHHHNSFIDQNLSLWLENDFFQKFFSNTFCTFVHFSLLVLLLIACVHAEKLKAQEQFNVEKKTNKKTCLGIQIYIVALKSILLNKLQYRETFLFSTQDCIELVNVCPNPPDSLESNDLGLKNFQGILNLSWTKNHFESWEKKFSKVTSDKRIKENSIFDYIVESAQIKTAVVDVIYSCDDNFETKEDFKVVCEDAQSGLTELGFVKRDVKTRFWWKDNELNVCVVCRVFTKLWTISFAWENWLNLMSL